ncbi:unnamed protein product [Knipowitschia caucasica]
MKENGTVTARADTPRSYLVQSPKGLIRQNRSHLVTLTGTKSEPEDISEPDLPIETSTPDTPPSPSLPASPHYHTVEKRYPVRERNLPGYLKDFDLSRRYSRTNE